MRVRTALGVLGVIAVVGVAAALTFRPVGVHGDVATLVVSRGELTHVAAIAGTIEPHAQVSLASRSSGEVVEVAVEEGQTVRAGEVLFRLDATDATRQVRTAEIELHRLRAALAQARAQLASAELDASESDTQAEVARDGSEQGLTSSDATRQSQHASSVAHVTVTLRRAAVDAAGAEVESATLALDEARRNLERTAIQAPFDGTILSVDVERGAIVSSAIGTVSNGTTLGTLGDLTDLRVIGQLDESQIATVEVGQDVSFRVDAYPTRSFTGRVHRVSPLGEEDSSVVVFDVEIVVTDADVSLLRSGMSADAEIVTSRLSGVLTVPLTAIRSRSGAREVVLPDGSARPVGTGVTDGERIVIESGLSEGDVIVADALSMRASPEHATSGLLPSPPRGGGAGGPPP